MVERQAPPKPVMRHHRLSKPLMMTKLRIPPFWPRLVARPALTRQIEANIHRKLTLICTPAGYGKTTLLSEWASQTQVPVAWVDLDEQDNRVERFWLYIITALRTAQEHVGEDALPLLYKQDFDSIETVLTSLINDLSLSNRQTVLILDNYHLIQTPAIHTTMAFFLEHMPTQLHIMIASRAQPPLPLSRLRGLGQLAGLNARDLRFSTSEIETLLAMMQPFKHTPVDSQTIESLTEGWIAGLMLAAHHQDTDPTLMALHGNHRHIADYFLEEIFDKQPKWIQEFLLATSILEQFNADLCIALTEQKDSRNTLSLLERDQVFILPLDETRQQYRYHRLFREFLYSRLQLEEPVYLQTLHHKAAAWYAAYQQSSDAIRHALAARDFEQAAQLAEASAEGMWTTGQIITLRQWLDALPSELVRSRPRLCLFYAWALFFSEQQLYAADAWVKDAEHLLTDAEPLAETAGMIETIRAAFAVRREQAAQTIELSHQALKQLPSPAMKWKSAATLSLGIGYATLGDMETAHRILAETSVLSQMADHLLNDIIAIYNQGRVQVFQGNLQQAAILFRRVIQLAAEHQVQLPIAGTAQIGLGYLFYEWNNRDIATEKLLDGIEHCKTLGNIEAPLRGYLLLAQLSRAYGETEQALEYLQLAEHLAHRAHQPHFVERVEAYQAKHWLSQGNLDAAVRWARRNRNKPVTHPGFQGETELLILARIWIAEGSIDDALHLLQTLLAEAEPMERIRSVIEIRVLQATAYEQRGDTESALSQFKQALSLAEPGGFIRLFADEGKVMATLLRHAASRGIASHYVSRILSAFNDSVHAPLSANQPLIDPLSERELEVLRLIAQGRSNHEIATELFVAVSTVKTHVKSIYRKLNVGSRFEAMERVRDLSLLNGEGKDSPNAWKGIGS